MPKKPTYKELALKIEQLESNILEYVHKEKELSKKRKFVGYSHIKRTISLININAELKREIEDLKRPGKKETEYFSDKLKERKKELTCLYDISSLTAITNYSIDDVLQAVVDSIPPATQYPEITCARIKFDRYELKTKNFNDTEWKLSQEIMVNNQQIGSLEVCYLEERQKVEEVLFLEETKNLIAAVSESIAQIVEHEQAEIEIRKSRNKIKELIKKK